jgi:hypothetical protein
MGLKISVEGFSENVASENMDENAAASHKPEGR